MKYLYALLLVLIVVNVNAQNVSIFEEQTTYEDYTYPAFSIYLEPETKEVKKELQDFVKDNYDVKLKGIGFLKNKDVLYAEEAKLERISNKKMDFYAKVIEEDGRTKLSFFGTFGYDIPLSPTVDNNAYQNLRQSMVEFLNDYLPGYYTEQVEQVKDEVEELREEKADLKEDIADNEEDITDKLAEIESLRKENKKLAEKVKETNNKLISSEMELKVTKGELDKIKSQLKVIKDTPK